VLGTVVVLGVVPREQLLKSVAPFADAARLMWGQWAAGVVAIAVIVSSIGALSGWTLLMGQVPMAAAQDRVFPAAFGRVSSRGVPALGIVISAALATLMVGLQALGAPGVRAFYNLVVSLSTMTAVVPYAFCALAVGLVAAGRAGQGPKTPRVGVVGVIAFVFSMFTIYGCGPAAVLYGLMLLLLGMPVYVWQRRRVVERN
jgi:arginine:agmatine antiporter